VGIDTLTPVLIRRRLEHEGINGFNASYIVAILRVLRRRGQL